MILQRVGTQPIKRRAFLLMVAGAAASPFIVAAQDDGRIVGILVPGNVDAGPLLNTFKGAMADLGYTEGKNIQFDLHVGGSEPASLLQAAEELVRRKVNIIVAWLTPAVRAAKQATTEIPIVIAGAGDPVATGLVKSLKRPGGNITGMAAVTPELAGKNIELARQLLPTAKRMAVLCNATDVFTPVFLEQVRAAGEKEKFELDVVMTGASGIQTAFRQIRDKNAQVVMIQPSLPVKMCARIALEARLAAICPLEAFTKVGGLLGYAGRSIDQYRMAADYVDKILKGSKPADLPIQLPIHFQLSINLKTARAIGLTVPSMLLAQADVVVE